MSRLCEESGPPQTPGDLLAHYGGSSHRQGPLSHSIAPGLLDAELLVASVSSSMKWDSTLGERCQL